MEINLKIKESDAALVIGEDWSVSFYLPNSASAETQKPHALVICILSVLLREGDKELKEILKKKADKILEDYKEQQDKEQWMAS